MSPSASLHPGGCASCIYGAIKLPQHSPAVVQCRGAMEFSRLGSVRETAYGQAQPPRTPLQLRVVLVRSAVEHPSIQHIGDAVRYCVCVLVIQRIAKEQEAVRLQEHAERLRSFRGCRCR